MPRKRGNKKRTGGRLSRNANPDSANHNPQNTSKSKSRSKGKGKKTWPHGKKRPTLSQVNSGTYPQLEELQSFGSMAMAAKNAGRRRYGFNDEIDYTGQHRSDTMRRPLRNMPIEFVKARELYDPSAELFERLANSKYKVKVATITERPIRQEEKENIENIKAESVVEKSDILIRKELETNKEVSKESKTNRETFEENIDNLLDDFVKDFEDDKIVKEIAPSGIKIQKEDLMDFGNEFIGQEQLSETKIDTTTLQPKLSSKAETKSVKEQRFKDDTDNTDESESEIIFIDDNENDNYDKELKATPQAHIHYELHDEEEKPVLRVGKFLGNMSIDNKGDQYITLPKLNFRKPNNFGFVDDHNEDEDEQSNEYYDDDFLDDDFLEEPKVKEEPVELDSDEDEGEDEYEEERMQSIRDYISKVMKRTLKEEDEDDENVDSANDSELDNGDIDVDKLMKEYKLEKRDQEEDDNDVQPNNQQLEGYEEDFGPEFGFLPEDYVSFDVTQIQISNIRMGATLSDISFEVKSPFLLGTDDYCWLDREDITEYLVEKGMPEHRISAFLKFATSHLENALPSKPLSPEPEYSDLEFIEDSSEEEEEEEVEIYSGSDSDSDSNNDSSDGLDEDQMEGIEDMIAFTKSNVKVLEDPIDYGTRTLKRKGKGKNKRIMVDHIEDPEMRKHLQDAYALRSSNKRESKKDRKQRRRREEEEGTDALLYKYPYDMQVTEIRQEFESLLKDSNKVSLRFPPLDPHGIDTLRKLSRHFNMNHKRVGKHPKCYFVVFKTNKSTMKSPEYSSIDRIMKQRPVFKRTDIGELSKREKLELKDKRKKSRGEKTSKGSNWNYKEGDVVGGNASEIGQDNVGHKLLLKMGWMQGEALGSEGNKGIVEPIEAKMKKTKLGIK